MRSAVVVRFFYHWESAIGGENERVSGLEFAVDVEGVADVFLGDDSAGDGVA